MLTTIEATRKRKIQKNQIDLKLYKSINDKSHLLSLKPGYIMQPSAAEVFQRKFMVHNLLIKNATTQIYWKGMTDLRNLKAPLSELIDLGQTYIEVYPKQQQKPMAGKQLNKTCFVTFSKLKHINKKKLKEICNKNQCQILAIDELNKQFTVQIPHFTKYAFGEVADDQDKDQQKEQIKINQIVNRPNRNYQATQLSNTLRQSYVRNLSKQKQAMRSGSIGYPIPLETKKNIIPTEKHENQVQKHNRIKNKHFIQGNRIKGTPQTVGINCRVSSLISEQNVHFLLFNKISQQKRDIIDPILQITRDSTKQIDYILSPNTKFQIKRALVLNMICFDFENCRFQFKKNQFEKLQLIKIQNAPQKYYQGKYFKSWFQWVLNQDSSLQLIQDQLIRFLVLRKGPKLAQKCLQFNQTDDAQFLSSIQDQSYRLTEVPRNLNTKLKAISIGDMSFFNQFSWLVRLAVYVWYYSFKQFENLSFGQIIDQKIKSQSDYYIQRHIFRLYLQKPFLIDNLTYVSDDQSPLWWYILNKNHIQEEKVNKQVEQYMRYRYSLVDSMVQNYANSLTALQLVSHEKILQKQSKQKILKNFIKQFPVQAERISLDNWKEYADLINQNKAIIHFSNDEYFKSLQFFSKCKSLTAFARIILNTIVSKQQIIFSFHTKTLEKCLKYFQMLKENRDFDISEHFLFVNTILGRQKLNKQKVVKLIYFVYSNIHIPQRRKKMLQVLFKQALKSHTIRSQLKKDDKTFIIRKPSPDKSLQKQDKEKKLSFYDTMKRYYKDPEYLLQLKFARLQI